MLAREDMAVSETSGDFPAGWNEAKETGAYGRVFKISSDHIVSTDASTNDREELWA